MNIALLGYGKMGQTIEKIALDRGHEIVLKVSKDIHEYDLDQQEIDVAIDFSIPDAAYKNLTTCFKHKIPVVCGTTGWLKQYEDAKKVCLENDSALIYASNFSLGVNVFFELNSYLANMMKGLDQYSVSIEEIHHTQKLDAPSGTAISLAEQIIGSYPKLEDWKLDAAEENKVPIFAKRTEDVPGTHTITYDSEIDSIEIRHTAKSRQGFALGAVVAAEYLHGRTGIFSMKDVLSELFQN